MLDDSLCSSPSFYNHTATPQLYTLSLHDALPISTSRAMLVMASIGVVMVWPRRRTSSQAVSRASMITPAPIRRSSRTRSSNRSEEHTSELQSRRDLVCRLLLEKKKKKQTKVRNQK